MVVQDIAEVLAKASENLSAIQVHKHVECDYDLGTLLVNDGNDLPNLNGTKKQKNDALLALTRENTQLLINKIWELPTERVEEALMCTLPPPKTCLPRSKPVPVPKPLTKWQKFAKEKGIGKKKKSKLTWDEQLKKWIPTYGFKARKAEKEKNWVLEVPQNADPMEDQFAKKATAKSENISKNELQRLKNIARARKVKIPRVGVLNPDVLSSGDLKVAVTVAKASTASLGKFQDKLPKEKEAKGIAEITPGASRKRKLPPTTGTAEKSENLAIVDSILNKRPKLDIDKLVTKNIRITDNSEEGDGPNNLRSRGFKNSGNKSKMAKKPKGNQGQRKNQSKGRKRR